MIDALLFRAAATAVLLLAAIPRLQAQGVPRGTVTARTIEDTVYHRTRRVWVYTPPGYEASAAARFDLIVAFDGEDWRDTIALPLVLDTLLAQRKAPAFVAVMIDDSTGAVRIAELANQRRFADFLAGQLIPWVRAGWNVTRDPRRTILAGASAGGLAASYVALEHPELFGNVLSLSGAVWRGSAGSNSAPFEWLTEHARSLPRREVRFLLDVGALESQRVMGGSGPVFIEANRRFRDALQAKGYEVLYGEVPGGSHSPASWKRQLPDAIVALTHGW